MLRVPVAFALGLACVPVFFLSNRLSPSLLFDQMFGSYNSFVLLAVPFFLLAANLMNSAGITQRLVDLSKALVGHLPGVLGQHPSLTDLDAGDLKYTVYFRNIYAGILQGWMGCDPRGILRGTWEPARVLARA